ncbi:MAG: hypothetical protein KTR20_09780 [Cellvibrionaceae bacterium]|nr:hypothetical protein [Cellvibrionaceae bacterium]
MNQNKPLLLLLVVLLQACSVPVVEAEGLCAGYQQQPTFKTDTPIGEKIGHYDMTGDSQLDKTHHWGKTGSALTINCGDGTYYTPIYSRASLAPKRSELGKWSSVYLQYYWFPEKTLDTFTWIDGQLHLFDTLPFDSNAPEEMKSNKGDLEPQIYFNQGRYTTDLSYCQAFDLYAPLYKFIRPVETNSTDEERLILVLKSGEYEVDYKNQSAYYFNYLKPVHINEDGIEDGYLPYGEIYGTGAQNFIGTFLGCGNSTYLFAADHQVNALIERGKTQVQR